MPSRFTRTLLAGAVLLLSACMSQPGAVPSPEPPVLDGTEWTVTKIKGADTVADSQPTIAFEDGKVSGTPGCNRFFGSCTQDGAKLEFGMMGTTEMACLDEGVGEQETAFLAALGEVTGVRAADPAVELTGADGAAILTLMKKEPMPDKALEGTEWTLTGIVENEAVSSIVGDKAVTLTIADGKLHASACNQINGDVTVDGQTLKVGPLMSTRMACPSEEETIQEGKLISYLEAATAFEIKGATLTITSGDNGLVFEAR